MSRKKIINGKKFKSVINRVVYIPMLFLALVGMITIIASVYTFSKVQKEIVDTNEDSLKIAQYQLDNYLNQIDYTFSNFMYASDAYRLTVSYKETTPSDSRLSGIARTQMWMDDTMSNRSTIDGIFAYFENIDLYLSKSNLRFPKKTYFQDYIKQGDVITNRWMLHEIDNEMCLLKIYHDKSYYGGAWISVDRLNQLLGLSEQNYIGIPYFKDQLGVNSREDVDESRASTILSGGNKKGNRVAVYAALPRIEVIKNLPAIIYVLFFLNIASIASIPFLGMWLKRKIANPLRVIDDAMVEIANGNVDYRIDVPEKDSIDEFARLSIRINDTLDELNETTYKLYEETLKGHQTKLNYYSQQIRPHFILNALNIIYTYEEHEFPLVKKMVLYLTDYFRYIVNVKKDFVDLSLEMEHAQNYLRIQKERYLDRFDFFVEWEAEIEHTYIPPLIIQTFAENCVKHGMKSGDKSFIYVLAGKADNNRIKLMIADTGSGFSDETFEKFQCYLETRKHQEGLGIGLENTVERLRILYDGEVDVRLRNALSGGAVVEVYLPIKTDDSFVNKFVRYE